MKETTSVAKALAIEQIFDAITALLKSNDVEIRVDDEIGHSYVDADDPLDVLDRPMPEYTGDIKLIQTYTSPGERHTEIALVVPLTDCRRGWFRRSRFLELKFQFQLDSSQLSQIAEALSKVKSNQ